MLLALNEDEIDRQVVAAMDTWKHSDLLARNYVLNSFDNTLYNVYCSMQTAKQLWESLDKKYKMENAGTKKFVVGQFLEYLIVDSKIVISQVQELQVILHEIHAEGMSLSEYFHVAAFIEKISPSWKDFKNYLKYKCKKVMLEELIVWLRIEEDNRALEKKIENGGFHFKAKANVVKQGHKDKKRKHPGQSSKGRSGSFKKFKGKCYKCDKVGHRAKDYHTRLDKEHANKKSRHAHANVIEIDNLSKDVSEMNLSAIVSEVNLVRSNTKEWWVDIGATRHVCSNRALFTTYPPVTNGERLYMGNSSTSKAEGQG